MALFSDVDIVAGHHINVINVNQCMGHNMNMNLFYNFV